MILIRMYTGPSTVLTVGRGGHDHDKALSIAIG